MAAAALLLLQGVELGSPVPLNAESGGGSGSVDRSFGWHRTFTAISFPLPRYRYAYKFGCGISTSACASLASTFDNFFQAIAWPLPRPGWRRCGGGGGGVAAAGAAASGGGARVWAILVAASVLGAFCLFSTTVRNGTPPRVRRAVGILSTSLRRRRADAASISSENRRARDLVSCERVNWMRAGVRARACVCGKPSNTAYN